MGDKLEDIQILFTKRNMRQNGPTSSDDMNDMVDEIAHDLLELNDQWNDRLVPLTESIPDGTDDVDVDAFTNGLDGRNLYVDQEASDNFNTSYYSIGKNRPNTIYEQFVDIYSNLVSLQEYLENQIDTLNTSASQISIDDAGGYYDATNVEDALAEIKYTVDHLAEIEPDLTGVRQDYLPAEDNVYDIGSAALRIHTVFVGPGSLRLKSKTTDGAYPAKDFTIGIDTNGKLQFIEGSTVVAQMSIDNGLELPEGGLVLDDIDNVQTVSPVSGQALKWDGTKWTNIVDPTGGEVTGAGIANHIPIWHDFDSIVYHKGLRYNQSTEQLDVGGHAYIGGNLVASGNITTENAVNAGTLNVTTNADINGDCALAGDLVLDDGSGAKIYGTSADSGSIFFLPNGSTTIVTIRPDLVRINDAAPLYFGTKSRIRVAGTGNMILSNAAGDDFGLLQLGGTTASFPAVKRSGTEVQTVLANDSGYCDIRSANLISQGAVWLSDNVIWNGGSQISSPGDGFIKLATQDGTTFSGLQFGGTTSAYPMLKRSGDDLQCRLADDSDYAQFFASSLYGASYVAAGSTGNISWNARTRMESPSDGQLRILNSGGTGFYILQLGGGTTEPALVVNGSELKFRDAWDVNDINITAKNLTLSEGLSVIDRIEATRIWADSEFSGGNAYLGDISCTSLLSSGNIIAEGTYMEVSAGGTHSWAGSSQLWATDNGDIMMTNAAGNDFGLLQFGGSDSSYPALKKIIGGDGKPALQVRLADDSDLGGLSVENQLVEGAIALAASGIMGWYFPSYPILKASSGPNILMTKLFDENDFGRLQFGGTTSSYPALRRNGAVLETVLADGSAYGTFGANSLFAQPEGNIGWISKGFIDATDDGIFRLSNNAGNGFTRLQFGGSNATFPAIKRSGTGLQFRLADDSDWAPVYGEDTYFIGTNYGGAFLASAINYLGWNGRSKMYSVNDGNISLYNNAVNNFNMLQFGGSTSSAPALKREADSLSIKLADDSAWSDLYLENLVASGMLTIREAASAPYLRWENRLVLSSPAAGQLKLADWSDVDFHMLQFGGTTSSYPSLKRNAANLEARLADDSAYTDLKVLGLEATDIIATDDIFGDDIFITSGIYGGSFFGDDITANYVTVAAGVCSGTWTCDYSTDLKELGTDALPPPPGYGRIFVKSDGRCYFRNDGGVIYDMTAGGEIGATPGDVLADTSQDDNEIAYWSDGEGKGLGGINFFQYSSTNSNLRIGTFNNTACKVNIGGASDTTYALGLRSADSSPTRGPLRIYPQDDYPTTKLDGDIFHLADEGLHQCVSGVWEKIGAEPIMADTLTPVGTTQTINWRNGDVQTLDLESSSGDVTITLLHGRPGHSYILKVIQDSVLARNVLWPSEVLWQGGLAPEITASGNAIDIIGMWYDGTNYFANFSQDYR